MSQAGRLFDGTVLADIETLTGNTGGAVGPDGAFNINIIGDATGTITVTGNPGTNTLTITDTARITSTVQTTDATDTTLYGETVSNNQLITLNVMVAGAKADYSGGLGGSLIAVVRREGANPPAIVYAMPNYGEDSTTGEPFLFFDVVGNDFLIRVRGEAGITYNWTGIIDRVTQS